MVDAISREAELEEVTDALLLTAGDDFNTLAAVELRNELGHRHVYRIAPHPEDPDLLPSPREGGIFVDRSLTFAELDRQFAAGARIVTRTQESARHTDAGPGELPLVVVSPDGRVSVAADGRPPKIHPGDAVVALDLSSSPTAVPDPGSSVAIGH